MCAKLLKTFGFIVTSLALLVGSNVAVAKVAITSVSADKDIYIIRHGATEDGVEISDAGQAALEAAWGKVRCIPAAKNFEINYLFDADGGSFNQRYLETAEIIKRTLSSKCPDVLTFTTKLHVRDLSVFDSSELMEIMKNIKSTRNEQTRIFILGSALLHNLTEDEECGEKECYLDQWPMFSELWDFNKKIFDIKHQHSIPRRIRSRAFMYNYIFHFGWNDEQNKLSCANTLSVPFYPISEADKDLDGNDYDNLEVVYGALSNMRSCENTAKPYGAEMKHCVIGAGPLLNNSEAPRKCGATCQQLGGTFTGGWWTTTPGVMSVCECIMQKCPVTLEAG